MDDAGREWEVREKTIVAALPKGHRRAYRGAGGEIRTRTPLRALDPKSSAAAITPPRHGYLGNNIIPEREAGRQGGYDAGVWFKVLRVHRVGATIMPSE